MKFNSKESILAGNPLAVINDDTGTLARRVPVETSNGKKSEIVFADDDRFYEGAGEPFVFDPRFEVDLQEYAFSAGLEYFARNRDNIGKIGIAFDQAGDIRSFLDPNGKRISRSLSGAKLTLADLHFDIRKSYLDILKDYGLVPSDVRVYDEGIARAKLYDALVSDEGESVNNLAITKLRRCERVCRPGGGGTDVDSGRLWPTCNGIFAGYLSRAAKDRKGVVYKRVVAHWEYDEDRCNPATIRIASNIAQKSLGVLSDIRNTFHKSDESGYTFEVDEFMMDVEDSGDRVGALFLRRRIRNWGDLSDAVNWRLKECLGGRF